MTITIRLVSCLLSLLAAVALFVHGLFVQADLETSSLPAIALFGFSILCFGIATACAIALRDALIEAAMNKSFRG